MTDDMITKEELFKLISDTGRTHFIDEVEKFNRAFGKVINNTPTIPDAVVRKFIYDFILEELDEYKEAAEAGDIVGVADAFADILYVLAGGILAWGMKDRFIDIFDEVQRSNMTKASPTALDAEATVHYYSVLKNTPCYWEKKEDGTFVTFRKSDQKVLKSISYSKADLKQFFKEDEVAMALY